MTKLQSSLIIGCTLRQIGIVREANLEMARRDEHEVTGGIHADHINTVLTITWMFRDSEKMLYRINHPSKL